MYEEEVFEECESGLEFVSDNTKSTSILVDEDMKLIYRIKATGITFDDVCGMDEAKQLLKLPLRNKGIVLFGLPGTGKSHILKAVVGEAQRNKCSTKFFQLSMADVSCITEKELNHLFMVAEKEKPSIIFVDDIHYLMLNKPKSNYDRHVRQMRKIFCKNVKYMKHGVFLIATTNKPHSFLNDCDVKKLFGKFIYISLPDKLDRLTMLKKLFTKESCNGITEEYLEKISTITEGYSGRDIDNIFREAYGNACIKLKDTSQPVLITMEDIPTLEFCSNPNSKVLNKIAKELNAYNGNRVLEQEYKYSSVGMFFAIMADFLFG